MNCHVLGRMLSGLCMLPVIVAAASVDPGELNRMREEAARAGVVPVTVHLHPSTLADLRSDAAKVSAAANAKAERLLTELGLDALAGGRWNNGVGQIGLHVTAHGLNVLVAPPMRFPSSKAPHGTTGPSSMAAMGRMPPSNDRCESRALLTWKCSSMQKDSKYVTTATARLLFTDRRLR